MLVCILIEFVYEISTLCMHSCLNSWSLTCLLMSGGVVFKVPSMGLHEDISMLSTFVTIKPNYIPISSYLRSWVCMFSWFFSYLLHSKNPPLVGKENNLAEFYLLYAKLGQRDQYMVDQRCQCTWRLAYPH